MSTDVKVLSPSPQVSLGDEKDRSNLDEKSPIGTGDEKTVVSGRELDAETGAEHGHLQELEVDLNLILGEKGEEDFESDHSPYPEGTTLLPQYIPALTLQFSSSSRSRCR